MQYGWDHPDTARAYEKFCSCHPRYARANRALVAASGLAPGQKILDLGAGTGRTAEAILHAVHGQCDLWCVEPAAAMRTTGARRVPGVRWMADWPHGERFDRILCGAAIWQLQPLADVFDRASAALLRPGALVFNIPRQYLCLRDDPGGGDDPWLTQIVGRLARERPPIDADAFTVLTEAGIETALRRAGFQPRAWSLRAPLTQAEYRDWLKIPVLTDRLMAELSADERVARLDVAYDCSDAASWRWEAWQGWTAWT
jgi:SAM-dependent methyltransferase